MRRRTVATGLIAAVGALMISACGSGAPREHSTTSAQPAVSASPADNPTHMLELAVRTAIARNAALSNYVLSHNVVPSSAAESTGGPALAALRQAAAQRTKQGVQMHGISPRFDVISVQLDASFTSATAVVRERGQVVPARDGKPLGRAIPIDDKASLQLRRIGTSTGFVVWKVRASR